MAPIVVGCQCRMMSRRMCSKRIGERVLVGTLLSRLWKDVMLGLEEVKLRRDRRWGKEIGDGMYEMIGPLEG